MFDVEVEDIYDVEPSSSITRHRHLRQRSSRSSIYDLFSTIRSY